MAWEAMSRAELEARITEALALYDEAVRAEWERIRIEPAKWRCSPWGDDGGGFWAVAVSGAEVLWYNDIEGGFNWSHFSERGVIGEYACNQTALAEILERVAQRLSAQAWEVPTASDVPAAIAGQGTILRRQTTYWDVQPRDGERCRIHFRDKQEHRFVESDYARAELHSTHPLLWSYTQEVPALYIAGDAADRGGLASELEQAIRSATSGWRGLADYRAVGPATGDLLSGGYGLLMHAPTTICAAVTPLLQRAGLRPSALGGRGGPKSPAVLTLGRNFVIARAFAFDHRPRQP